MMAGTRPVEETEVVIGEKPMSVAEKEHLAELETTIKANLRGFYAVGLALREIQEKRLYRQKYKSFEEYCKTKWDAGKRRAYQLISASEVFESVNSCAQKKSLSEPINEAQIRPLTREELSPEDQVECWKAACQKAESAGRKVTAHYVEEAVIEFIGGRKKRQLREVRKNLNDAEFTLEFKRALTPVIQMLHDAQETGWRDTSRRKILELLDSLRAIVAGEAE